MKYSEQQKDIIRALMKGHNVQVGAVAGSGKTTSIELIHKAYPNLEILIITYNKRLKFETRQRLKDVEVHTYHSYINRYYQDCHDDTGFEYVIDGHVTYKGNKKYDLLVVDEIQDMNMNYYKIVRKILNDCMNKNNLMVVLGDSYQEIYKYNKSDNRFITMANMIFPGKWSKCRLNITYRLTKPMASFINEVVLDQPNYMISHREGPEVEYIIDNIFSAQYMYDKITGLLSDGYRPDDIFVLSYSVLKGTKRPLTKLANKITMNTNIPIYITSDKGIVKNDNRIIFSTFHQVKGLERKIVIVYNFDESYYKYCKIKSNLIDNPLYVALTRSLERLILIHNHSNKALPFIDYNKLKKHCKIINTCQRDNCKKCMNRFDPIEESRESHNQVRIVSEICDFKHVSILNKIYKKIKKKTIQNRKSVILEVPNVSNGEFVGHITGLAIPLLYEIIYHNKSSIISYLLEQKNIGIPEKYYDKFKQVCRSTNIENILYTCNLYSCHLSNYIYPLKQIKKYDWISQKDTYSLIKNINNFIGKSTNQEFEIYLNIPDIGLSGRVDMIDHDKKIVYEFKCKRDIANTDIIQLFVYGNMLICNDDKYLDYKYYIYNVLNNEVIEIMFEFDLNIIDTLMNTINEKEDDNTFVEKCLKYDPSKVIYSDIFHFMEY